VHCENILQPIRNLGQTGDKRTCDASVYLVPYVIIMNTRSNGLGAGLYVLSIACFIPAASLINGILAAAERRKLWFLPAVPAILSLLLYPVSRDMYLSFQLTPVLALAVGYAAMTLCAFLLKQKKNKKS